MDINKEGKGIEIMAKERKKRAYRGSESVRVKSFYDLRPVTSQ